MLTVLGLNMVIPFFSSASSPLFPDMQTVIPLQVQIVNAHQKEILRFSNTIANTGEGSWRMRPEFFLTDPDQPQKAIQEILDENGNITEQKIVSEFQFHPEHNHWHIYGVALFEIRSESPVGPVFGNNSIKTTFCLIDWYKLEDNSPTKERTYFDCFGNYQGISPGWADQYHQSTEGQQLDVTGIPMGRYYLVSTANPESIFLEKNYQNNSAWVSFDVKRDSSGNPKIKIVDHSFCENDALCGVKAPNR